MEHLHWYLNYFDTQTNSYKFILILATIKVAFHVSSLSVSACWTLHVLFFLRLSSMKNIHDCWQVPVCGLCFSQFSPWKPQMVGIRMTMADIIIQMVLVVAVREAWWWCELLHDDAACSCEKPKWTTWLCALLIFRAFFFSVLPKQSIPAAAEAVNISNSKFAIKMSPGQTGFGKSSWGLVQETHCALAQQLLSRSGQ